MLPNRPDAEALKRLERLAKETGRSKSSLVREATLAHLEDVEDVQLATERLKHPGKTYSSQEVKDELGL